MHDNWTPVIFTIVLTVMLVVVMYRVLFPDHPERLIQRLVDELKLQSKPSLDLSWRRISGSVFLDGTVEGEAVRLLFERRTNMFTTIGDSGQEVTSTVTDWGGSFFSRLPPQWPGDAVLSTDGTYAALWTGDPTFDLNYFLEASNPMALLALLGPDVRTKAVSAPTFVVRNRRLTQDGVGFKALSPENVRALATVAGAIRHRCGNSTESNEALLALLADPEADVSDHAHAMHGLTNAEPERIDEWVALGLQSSHWPIRLILLEHVRSEQMTSAIATISKFTEVANDREALALARTIDAMGDASCEAALLAVLDSDNDTAQELACDILGRIGTPRSISRLEVLSSRWIEYMSVKASAEVAVSLIRDRHRSEDIAAGGLSLLEPHLSGGELSAALGELGGLTTSSDED